MTIVYRSSEQIFTETVCWVSLCETYKNIVTVPLLTLGRTNGGGGGGAVDATPLPL